MRQTLSQSRSVRERGGLGERVFTQDCEGTGCTAMLMCWRGDRAPPARRFAGKPAPTLVSGQSLLRPARATALFVRRDIEVCAKAFARKCHRHNWPETNVGAGLPAKRRAGGARFAPQHQPQGIHPEPTRNLSPFQPAPSSIQTGCCCDAGSGLPAALHQRSYGRHWKNAAPTRNHKTARSG